jgi:outer membrane protein assembly factor BamB
MHRPRARRFRRPPILAPLALAAALLLVGSAGFAAAPPTTDDAPAATAPAPAPAAADPLLGNWWGTIVAPHETVDFGLELRRNAEGGIEAAITQPGANYFDLLVPGTAQRGGTRVTLESLSLDATLDGDHLSGKLGRSQVPVDLHRVAELPSQPAVPSLPAGPGPRWQTRLNGQVFASPVVADGVAYVGTTGGVFNAVKTADGSFAWTFPAGRPILGAARIDGDAIYFTCDNGYLFKLDRATGKEVWRYDLGDGRASRILGHPAVFDWDWHGARPLIAGGVVFVGSGDGSFHAVDAATGERRWRAETGGRIRGGAALDGDRVFAGSADHFVYAFDRASGRELWKHDTEAEVEDELLAAGGRLFVGNRGIGLIALAAATGDELWHTTFWGSWLESTPTLVDGVLYVGSSDLGRVSALDPADGRVLWRSDVFGWTFGTPLVTDKRIYAGAAGGTPYFTRHVAGFCVLDRATGKVVERWPLADSAGAYQWGIASSLALAGDTIVATTIDGSIYGFPAG